MLENKLEVFSIHWIDLLTLFCLRLSVSIFTCCFSPSPVQTRQSQLDPKEAPQSPATTLGQSVRIFLMDFVYYMTPYITKNHLTQINYFMGVVEMTQRSVEEGERKGEK